MICAVNERVKAEVNSDIRAIPDLTSTLQRHSTGGCPDILVLVLDCIRTKTRHFSSCVAIVYMCIHMYGMLEWSHLCRYMYVEES